MGLLVMDWLKKISFDIEVQQSNTKEIPTPSYDCPFDKDDSLVAKVPFRDWDVINLWDAWLTFGTNNEVGRGTSKNKFNGRIEEESCHSYSEGERVNYSSRKPIRR